MNHTFSETILIEATPAAVWEILSDIGTIARWNPGVRASHTLSEQVEGIGAARYCDLGGRNYLEEAVVAWEPEKQLTMRITGTNMPFQAADIRFLINPLAPNQTEVTVSPLYTLKFGPLGRLLERAFVRTTYQKGMVALLRGLKDHAEAITKAEKS